MAPPPVAAQPNVPAPYAAAGLVPNVGLAPGWEAMQGYLLNSPMYKQSLETLTNAYNTASGNAAQLAALQGGLNYESTFIPQTAFNEQYFPETFVPEVIPQAYYDQLEQQQLKGEHDFNLRQKAIPEIMAGRGMLSSGQTGFELGESQYSFDTLLRDIELGKNLHEQDVAGQNLRGQTMTDLGNTRGAAINAQNNAARADSIAQSNASGAAAAARQNANAQIQHQIDAVQAQQQQAALQTQLAQNTQSALMQTASFYQSLWWDPSTGQYVGPTG
jgi:hypothetical protein